ncbi:hypothetical protein T484DRAFT_1774310 [Baffinella frigidus]|nr:hypothetical protein T484DRAFT_1774310 [Cryptophyta sp. CCMP2293]
MDVLNQTAVRKGLGLLEYCKRVKQEPQKHSLDAWSEARRCLSVMFRRWKRFHVRAVNDPFMEALERAAPNVTSSQLITLHLTRGYERALMLKEEGLSDPEGPLWSIRGSTLFKLQKSSISGFIRERTSALYQDYLENNTPITMGVVMGDPDPTFSSYDDEATESEDQSEVTLEMRREEEWSEKFKVLLRFFEREGHTAVPKKYAELPGLGGWVSSQYVEFPGPGGWVASQRARLRAGRMEQSRLDRLSEVAPPTPVAAFPIPPTNLHPSPPIHHTDPLHIFK